jgi:RNA polymerase sigma factor (sigma-70 family)
MSVLIQKLRRADRTDAGINREIPYLYGVNQAQTIALYQPMLQSVAYNILRCKADAEDIVQDTFVKWLSAEQEKIQNTKAYLIQAVRNNCLTHLATLKRKKEEYLESIDLSRLKGKFTAIDFSHLDLEAEMSKALTLMQHKLEPLERAVYLLKDVFDFDYASVQKALDKKQEHCRQLLCRARKKLSNLEVPKITLEMPDTSGWMESFRSACVLGNATELVAQLRKDIAPAEKK